MDSFEEAIRDHLRLRGDTDQPMGAQGLGPSTETPRAEASPLASHPDGGEGSGSEEGTRGRDRIARPRRDRLGAVAHSRLAGQIRRSAHAARGARIEVARGVRALKALTSRVGAGRLAFLAAVVAVAIFAAFLLPATLSAMASDRIADGMRVGGIPLGGLSVNSARRRLETRLAPRSRESLVVRAGTRSWKLTAAEAHVSVDASQAAETALAQSRRGAFFSRVLAELPGRTQRVDLVAPVSYSHPAVVRLIDHVARAIDRSPQDATVRPVEDRLVPVADRPGVETDRGALAALIESRLAAPVTSRSLDVPTHEARAKVTMADVPVKYRNYVLIRRPSFRLEYFHALRRVRSYPIAVGRQGLETPAGLYEVQGKQVDPPWQVPNSSWAGDKAGKLIPPGPDDPIKARWLGFNGSAGIHGTDDIASLGQAASHGCVRMSIPNVKDLYRRVPLYTPVEVE